MRGCMLRDGEDRVVRAGWNGDSRTPLRAHPPNCTSLTPPRFTLKSTLPITNLIPSNTPFSTHPPLYKNFLFKCERSYYNLNMKEASDQRMWEGEFGWYVIPEEFAHVRISKTGWPDLRQKEALRFLEWAARMDRNAKEAQKA